MAVGTGRITATGAPSRTKVDQWARMGVTDVVTLQRADEHAAWLPQACADAEITWHHLPLSGRRLEHPDDAASLARMPRLAELLRATPPRSILVHCAAGLHRTGVCLYMVLRAHGLTGDEAVETIASARPLTAEELCRETRRGTLRETAEAAFMRNRP